MQSSSDPTVALRFLSPKRESPSTERDAWLLSRREGGSSAWVARRLQGIARG
jgi:hypothetical protein